MIYLDHNATTPVHPNVLEKMLPFFTEHFGNAASSHHPYGWKAKDEVEKARELIASILGCGGNEVLFTSGATESLRIALLGLVGDAKRIIVNPTEHSAVLNVAKELESSDVQLDYLKVDSQGIVDLRHLKELLKSPSDYIAVQLANNETGAIQPIREIAQLVHDANSILISDTTQAIGKIPVDFSALGIDVGVCSAHKCYGPKGIGALIVRNQLKQWLSNTSQMNQEFGIRAGTLNVTGIIGLSAALEYTQQHLEDYVMRISDYRMQIEHALLQLNGVNIHSHQVDRIPNTISCSISGCDIQLLMRMLKGIAISQGSACHSNVVAPSHVLTAMGIPKIEALQTIRISLGLGNTQDEVERSIEFLTTTIQKAQNLIA